MAALTLIAGMFFSTLIGLPVGFAIAGCSFLGLLLAGVPLEAFVNRFLHSMLSYAYLAVPFFILTGQLMNVGKMTNRLFDFSNQLVGHMKGGLAQVNIVVSMIFAGISGAALADVAGIGTVLIQEMEEKGYEKDFSVAITAASATVGPIIPPSIILVIIAITGQYSIGALLLGGLVPGLMMGFLMMILTYFLVRGRDYPVKNRASLKELWKSFLGAIPALGAPIIIVGGVMTGFFTATESGAIAAIYCIILSFFYRTLNWEKIVTSLRETVKTTAVIFLLIASAHVFAWLLAYHQTPRQISHYLTTLDASNSIILIGFSLLYLLLGTFMSSSSIVVMTLPVLSPALLALGVDPIHLGILAGINLSLGTITPPFGICMFVVCKISNLGYDAYIKAIWPYLALLIGFLFVLIFAPSIITFLPRFFGFH